MGSTSPPQSCCWWEAAAGGAAQWDGGAGQWEEAVWGGLSQGDGRAVGMWLTHWGAAPVAGSGPPSPLLAQPWDTQGQPVWGSCPAEVCEAARFLCCLQGSWASLCSALLLQLLDFYTEMCPVWPKPAVAFWLALQGRPLGFFISSLHTVKGVPWCSPGLSPRFILLVEKCQNIFLEVDCSSFHS